MQTIKTNEEARQKRILNEVNLAFGLCQKAANDGRSYVYFTTDKDIWRDIRDELETNHKIFVPIKIGRYTPSSSAVEHLGEKTEMKLTWL